MNESLLVQERMLCADCANALLAEKGEELEPAAVVRQVDPTVCAKCQTDNGSEELPHPWGMPLCGACEAFVRNRPYPGWLKLAFVVLVGVAIFSLWHNGRFLRAHVALLQAERAAKAGDMERYVERLQSAAELVPERADLQAAAAQAGAMMRAPADLLRAAKLLEADQPAEALQVLQALPPDVGPFRGVVERVRLTAEMSLAFDRKDYDLFLEKTKEMLKLEPDEPRVIAGMASAYACKYAVTGKEELRKEALDYLERARRLPGANHPEFREYEERILHRLETREILKREEFRKRFPEGWKKGAK